MEDLHFDYINKPEASFLIGLLKHTECFNCPCFYLGCEGNYPIAQIGGMSSKEYLYTQKKGTETYLCGKLRNIVISEDMRLIELEQVFDSSMKKDIGYLHKTLDKCVVKSGSYDLEIRNVEYILQKRLDAIIEDHNKQILTLQSMLSDKEKALENLEKELASERIKNTSQDQYNQKAHDTITKLQRTVFEQNQKLSFVENSHFKS